MSVERIAILHYAAPPVIGGVESTIYHHARLLKEAGYQVDVVAGRGRSFYPGITFHRIPETDSQHSEVIAVGHALASEVVPPSFASLRDRLAEHLRSVFASVDVCIVHNAITLHKNLPLTAALYRLAREGDIPLIAWCHDFAWQDKLYTPDLHPGYPWVLLRTPWPNVRYVVVSAHRRRRLAGLLGLSEDRVAVVHPGVDVGEFLKLEPATLRLVDRLDLLSADPIMLLPARITRRKNIQFAIQITAALTLHKPQAALVVTGPPGAHNPTNIAYLESLRTLRQELGVAERIHFLYEYDDEESSGAESAPLYVTNAMMADLFQLADLLLFPSRKEGFGIPPLEAGLARLPIFAANIPTLQESAGDLAHLFDPEGDPGAVAEAIAIHLSKDQAYQMRRRVLSQFTWEAVLERCLIPLIQEVAGYDQ